MSARLRTLARSWVLPFVDPRKLRALAALPGFLREMRAYRSLSAHETVELKDAYPCLSDRVVHTPFDPHYFYQGAWLARRLAEQRPARHVDVGSSVLMVSVLSAQVPVLFVDYRPLASGLPNIEPVGANVTRLPFANDSIASLSSLHVIEHVGLGRYGDPLDAGGSRAAARELVRVLAPRGRLYLSVPVGRERVCFNAHRVFAPRTIAGFAAELTLERFALVDDRGQFSAAAALDDANGLDYGCGMFEFSKPA